jgi:ABC-type microcin C transport system duplicated ATPase subunit YejF
MNYQESFVKQKQIDNSITALKEILKFHQNTASNDPRAQMAQQLVELALQRAEEHLAEYKKVVSNYYWQVTI